MTPYPPRASRDAFVTCDVIAVSLLSRGRAWLWNATLGGESLVPEHLPWGLCCLRCSLGWRPLSASGLPLQNFSSQETHTHTTTRLEVLSSLLPFFVPGDSHSSFTQLSGN